MYYKSVKQYPVSKHSLFIPSKATDFVGANVTVGLIGATGLDIGFIGATTELDIGFIGAV
jgi:hypothetical protein